MRISDWSSDVCSSDLVVGLLLGGEGRATALVSLTGLHDPAAVARVARLNGAALLDMKAASESLVVAYRGRVLAALAVAAVLLALTVWIAMRMSRSEEHTSELQSLMRISYAVFCLNKKKKYNVLIH